MSDAPEKDIKEAVVPEPGETTPAPEVTPPAVTEEPKDDLKATVDALASRIDSLAETVSQVVTKAEPDTKPTKKPWTHWGSNR